MREADAADHPKLIAPTPIAWVDADLMGLIPGYIENRRKDVVAILDALARGDLEYVSTIGHSMKGSGGGYGFHTVSKLGAALEEAARESDAAAIQTATARLQDYLARVEVVYRRDPE